jgi:hypothetical protein
VEGTTGKGIISDATETLAAGDYHAVVRLKVDAGVALVELLKDSVVVASTTQSRTSIGDWDRMGLEPFVRVSLPYTAASSGTYQVRVTTSGSGTFYVDACEFREGEDDLSEYIAESEPRCRPTTEGTFHDTTAYRQPFWLVYISAIQERFQAPKTVYEGGERVTKYDTVFNVQLREAW